MAPPRRCEAGHELSSNGKAIRPCPRCSTETVAARVAAADPTLAPAAGGRPCGQG
jgi:hypothetical protein